MLSRDKARSEIIGISRNNTISLTYDIKNTSTKLILLNFSKKNDNRLRGHETVRDISVLPNVLRCPHCLTQSAPACACYHRDKTLSFNKNRHEKCSTETGHSQKQPVNITPKASHPAKLPPCPEENTRSNVNRKTNLSSWISSQKLQRSYKRDVEMLYSMPSFCHPDFTEGQRRTLLSLARIYTNIRPNGKSETSFFKRGSKLHYQSKEKDQRRSKCAPKNQGEKKDGTLRQQSLQTAVGVFSRESGMNHVDEDKHFDDEYDLEDDPDLEDLLEDYITTIIQDQLVSLARRSNSHDEQGRVNQHQEGWDSDNNRNNYIDEPKGEGGKKGYEKVQFLDPDGDEGVLNPNP